MPAGKSASGERLFERYRASTGIPYLSAIAGKSSPSLVLYVITNPTSDVPGKKGSGPPGPFPVAGLSSATTFSSTACPSSPAGLSWYPAVVSTTSSAAGSSQAKGSPATPVSPPVRGAGVSGFSGSGAGPPVWLKVPSSITSAAHTGLLSTVVALSTGVLPVAIGLSAALGVSSSFAPAMAAGLSLTGKTGAGSSPAAWA